MAEGKGFWPTEVYDGSIESNVQGVSSCPIQLLRTAGQIPIKSAPSLCDNDNKDTAETPFFTENVDSL
jgi:hypothetical protein